jgi:hypothetical protein
MRNDARPIGESAPASPLGGADPRVPVERRGEAPPEPRHSDVVHRSPDDQEQESEELDDEDVRPLH